MINKKRKPETKTKAAIEQTPEATLPVDTTSEPVQEEKATQPLEEVTATLAPVLTPTPVIIVEPPVAAETPALPPKPKPLNMANLKVEVDELRALIQTLTTQMTDVESQLTLKRKPAANGKVQIKDTVTDKIYKSKNNFYQTRLKAGELKDLVEKGILGAVPTKGILLVSPIIQRYLPSHKTYRCWSELSSEAKP
jgi:hypothetical protein